MSINLQFSSVEWRRILPALTSECAWVLRVCSATDLKKVTDIFTRMFHDPQSKVLSVFVEVVVDFVAVHVDDLSHWLPILLPRLFLKLTSDLRGSIHTKVERALEAVRWLPFSIMST